MKRFQQIQYVTEQKKIQLMEAAELQHSLDSTAQEVVAWTDAAQSLAVSTETMHNPQEVRARVDEHQVRGGGSERVHGMILIDSCSHFYTFVLSDRYFFFYINHTIM